MRTEEKIIISNSQSIGVKMVLILPGRELAVDLIHLYQNSIPTAINNLCIVDEEGKSCIECYHCQCQVSKRFRARDDEL